MKPDISKLVGSEIKWKIVESLSKKDKAVTELAREFNTSLSNISQQLSGLEASNIVKKTGKTEKGTRRPLVKYSIGRGFVFLVEAMPKEARKTFIEVDENIKTHLRIWSIPQKEFHYFIESFWWALQDYLDDIESVAVFGSVAKGNAKPDSDMDILLLARQNQKILEKEFSAKMAGQKGKGKMIMSQVFPMADFENSVRARSAFAREVINSMTIIHDPNDFLYGLKEKYGKP